MLDGHEMAQVISYQLSIGHVHMDEIIEIALLESSLVPETPLPIHLYRRVIYLGPVRSEQTLSATPGWTV